MANETMLGIALLQATLTGDSTLMGLAPGGVWRALAPDGTSTPFVILRVQSPGMDTLTSNAVRVLSKPLYQVAVCAPAKDTVSLVSAEARLDTVLGGRDGLRNQAVTGGLVLALFRESPFQQDEEVNGVLLTSLGGLYRAQIQQQ